MLPEVLLLCLGALGPGRRVLVYPLHSTPAGSQVPDRCLVYGWYLPDMRLAASPRIGYR